MGHLRYVCLLQQGARPRDEWAFSPEEVARLQAQANQLPTSQVVHGLDLLADAQVRIRHGGADPRLQLELVAARLSRPALDASAAGAGRPGGGPRGRRPARRRAAAAPRSRRPRAPPRPPAAAGTAPPAGPRRERRGPPAHGADARRPRARAAGSGRRCSTRSSATRRPRAGCSTAHARAEIDERRLVVAVTSPLRADMLGRPEHRERVRIAVESVAGRRWPSSSPPAPRPPEEPAGDAPALDDDALLAEFKSMFSAVEEGERPDRGG